MSPFHLLQPFKDTEKQVGSVVPETLHVLYKGDDVKSETSGLCKYLLMPPATEDTEKGASPDSLL